MEALTTEDVAILDLESPTIAGHTCKVVVLDSGGPPPTIDDVRAHVEARLTQVPRCCECIVASPEPAWTDPVALAIADHVRLAPEGESLDTAVGRAMMGRLDRSRPLWDLELLPAIGDGQWALVWRVHHAMADGMTMMQWASDLLWDEPPQGAGAGRVAEPPSAAPLLAAVADETRRAVSVSRELRPARAAGPFGGRVGERRHAALASCSLDDLRTIEHGAG